MPRRLLVVLLSTISLVAVLISAQDEVSASPGDIYITQLSCDSSPEFVSIKNFGGSSQSLTGFAILRDPGQNQVLSTHVASISAAQTLTFQSGTGSADNPGAGIYKLTGSFIYRNGDSTDYARLARSDATSHQVNCGSVPPTPPPTAPPTATPTPTPVPTPTPSPTPVPTQPPVIYFGDTDCSGSINSVEALKVLRSSAGLSVSLPPWCTSFNADIDCSGTTNSVDALKLLRYSAGLSITQNEPCTNIGTVPGSTPTPGAGVLAIHHIDVEQGDAALIVSPGGDAVIIDTGRWTNCSNTVSYVQGQGLTSLKYSFATHYDADHIGCLDDLAAAGITVSTACYDRGGSAATDTYNDYIATCGAKRQTAFKGQIVSLAGGGSITVVDLNGAGVSTSEENALGLILKLTYGAFDHVFAGDLPGESPDIESVVGPEVGDVDVCKVNHHGSASSSTDAWLNAISPEVCILSVGANPYGHPTAEAMARIHGHEIETYWTNAGSGSVADPLHDHIVGDVVITVASGSYSVNGDSYAAQ